MVEETVETRYEVTIPKGIPIQVTVGLRYKTEGERYGVNYYYVGPIELNMDLECQVNGFNPFNSTVILIPSNLSVSETISANPNLREAIEDLHINPDSVTEIRFVVLLPTEQQL